jgi:hypothetical protein
LHVLKKPTNGSRVDQTAFQLSGKAAPSAALFPRGKMREEKRMHKRGSAVALGQTLSKMDFFFAQRRLQEV